MEVVSTKESLYWKTLIVAVCALTLMLFAGLAFVRHSAGVARQQDVIAATNSLAEQIMLRLDGNANFIALLAEQRGEGKLDAGVFQRLATPYIADHPELINITWVDANGIIQAVSPLPGNAQIVGLPLVLPAPLQAAQVAKRLGRAVYSAPFEAIQGGPSFEIWMPVFVGSEHRGWLAGVYSCTALLQHLVSPELAHSNRVTLIDVQGHEICGTSLLGDFEQGMRHQRALTSDEKGIALRLQRYAQGPLGLLLVFEAACLLLALGVVYSIVRLRREYKVRRQAEDSLRIISNVFERGFDSIMVIDPNLNTLNVNPAYCHMTGFTKEEIVGRRAGGLLAGQSRRAIKRMVNHNRASQTDWQLEIQGYRKNGDLQDYLLKVSYVSDASGQLCYYIAVIIDITYLKQHAAELERTAYYDTLTGLPNRLLMTQRTEDAIAQNKGGHSLAVCYLDLDDFQSINHDYGQDAGDRVLVEVASRLQAVSRQADVVAHVGGDEFMLLYTNLRSADDCDEALDDVLAAVRTPIAVDGFSLKLSTSIGVTFYPLDHSTADGLIRHANQAMHHAKEAGKNRLHLFDAERERKAKVRFEMLLRLQQALNAGEFTLYYQPKVDLVDNRVVGAEALIRWSHPERGMVAPGEFLPYLEGSDLEIAVGEWVIETALRQIEAWLHTEAIAIPVSVNISAKHLLQPDFTERLRLAMARHPGLPEHVLELEVVETTALSDLEIAIETLTACKQLGVRFALDDFGTGYSSLTYFQRLPVDTLKIDQSFVRDMLENRADLEIIESVVKLAQVFNRAVIAEGIETDQHATMLRNIGCRFGQGYGIARPMPAAQLLDWVKQWEQQARAEIRQSGLQY